MTTDKSSSYRRPITVLLIAVIIIGSLTAGQGCGGSRAASRQSIIFSFSTALSLKRLMLFLYLIRSSKATVSPPVLEKKVSGEYRLPHYKKA